MAVWQGHRIPLHVLPPPLQDAARVPCSTDSQASGSRLGSSWRGQCAHVLRVGLSSSSPDLVCRSAAALCSPARAIGHPPADHQRSSAVVEPPGAGLGDQPAARSVFYAAEQERLLLGSLCMHGVMGLSRLCGGVRLLSVSVCPQGDLEALHAPGNLPRPGSCHCAVAERERLDLLMASTCSCSQQGNGDCRGSNAGAHGCMVSCCAVFGRGDDDLRLLSCVRCMHACVSAVACCSWRCRAGSASCS